MRPRGSISLSRDTDAWRGGPCSWGADRRSAVIDAIALIPEELRVSLRFTCRRAIGPTAACSCAAPSGSATQRLAHQSRLGEIRKSMTSGSTRRLCLRSRVPFGLAVHMTVRYSKTWALLSRR